MLAAKQLEAWEHSHPIWLKFYPEIVCLAGMLLITAIMTRYADRRPLRSIGLTGARAGRHFLLGLGLGTLWLAIPLFVAWQAGWVVRQSPEPFSLLTLGAAGLALLMNIITQQLLLCGYILQTIQARFGFRPALVISVILFSAYHAAAFHGAFLPPLNVMLAGTVFGLCYRLSGSLWLPIGCHFAWNFLLGLGLGLTVSGTQRFSGGWQSFSVTSNLFTGGSFGFEGGLLTCVATLLFALALGWALRSAPAEPKGSGFSTPPRR